MVIFILLVICFILVEFEFWIYEDDIVCERVVVEVFDIMVISLFKKYVFLLVLYFVMFNFYNLDFNYRDVVVMLLGVILEGCYEVMKFWLEDVFLFVLEVLKDKE